jgi:hypothetical protein
MVGLINFHFSNGMIALYVDQPTDPTSEQEPTTFRSGFTTHEEVWQVIRSVLILLCETKDIAQYLYTFLNSF